MVQYVAFPYAVFILCTHAPTATYTLSLHDALPILITEKPGRLRIWDGKALSAPIEGLPAISYRDRKSTRLNSSHGYISYAVFCLKKKIKWTHVLAPTGN